MKTAQWNQVVAAVEQLPAEKQEVLAALVLDWLNAVPLPQPDVPVESRGRHRAGSAAGQFTIPPEFDEPLVRYGER